MQDTLLIRTIHTKKPVSMFVSNSTAQFRDRMAYAEKKMQPLKIVGKHSKNRVAF